MDAYIYDAVRTPRGSARSDGSLTTVKPIQLISMLIAEVTKRNNLDKDFIEDIILGCVTQTNEQGANIGKIAALWAGLPDTVSGTTVNKFCASGLEATAIAALKTHAATEEVVLAGGVESVSRVPMFSDKGAWFADDEVRRKTGFVQMGVSADLIATLEGFSRTELDEYAQASQERSQVATENNYFNNSLIPIKSEDGSVLLDHDELIRKDSSLEKLAELSPSFEKFGVGDAEEEIYKTFEMLEKITYKHHPGNSPSLADGASLLVIGNKASGDKLQMQPKAKIISVASAAANRFLLTGGQVAAQKVLKQANLSVKDIDLFEYNEAFSATVLKFIKDMNIDPTLINVNGGAIAMGHALGATGGMLVMTLIDELERRDLKRGLVAVSGGGGIGTALIVERI